MNLLKIKAIRSVAEEQMKFHNEDPRSSVDANALTALALVTQLCLALEDEVAPPVETDLSAPAGPLEPHEYDERR